MKKYWSWEREGGRGRGERRGEGREGEGEGEGEGGREETGVKFIHSPDTVTSHTQVPSVHRAYLSLDHVVSLSAQQTDMTIYVH